MIPEGWEKILEKLEKAVCVSCGLVGRRAGSQLDPLFMNASSGKGRGFVYYCNPCYKVKTEQAAINNLEKARLWRKNNAEKVSESRRRTIANRKQWKAENGGRHTREQFNVLVVHYSPDGKCPACFSIGPLSADHVIPLANGGSDDISNIQPLCQPCNARKGHRFAKEYRPDNGEFAKILSIAVNLKPE